MDRNVKQLEFIIPTISYKQEPLDLFVHIDFIQRWFKVLNLDKLREHGIHTNVVFGKNGGKYVFREAFFRGFKDIFNNDFRMVVQNECGDMWVLNRDWVKTFQQISVNSVDSYKIRTYRDVLFHMAEFYLDGESYSKTVERCFIEMNKN